MKEEDHRDTVWRQGYHDDEAKLSRCHGGRKRKFPSQILYTLCQDGAYSMFSLFI